MKTKFFSLLFMVFAAQFATAQMKQDKTTKTEAVSKDGLDQYKGSYVTDGSKDVNLIYVAKDKLMLKVPGKPSMHLEADGKDSFKSEKGDMLVAFDTKNKLFVMNENGKKQTYKMQ